MSNRIYICDKHDYAIKCLKNVISNIEYALNNYETIEDYETLVDDIKTDIECNAISELEDAVVMSESMEDRLSDYRQAIESLGFVRNGGM